MENIMMLPASYCVMNEEEMTLMEEQRQMYREYLESNGIRFFQEPHKLTG